MRILITGAGGFVGSHLTAYLAEAGHTVYAARHPEDHGSLSAAAAVYDLVLPDEEAVTSLLRRVQPQVVYHLAARSGVAAAWEHPFDTVDVNICGTLQILEGMRRCCPGARLMLIGSAEVYGIPRSNGFGAAEDEPLQPANLYGVTKACGEQLAMVYHKAYGLDVVAIRAYPHIGVGQSAEFVLSGFCRQLAAMEAGQQPAELSVGNLQVRRDFTDVRDVVRAYGLLAEKGISGRCYNVGSGKAVLLADVVEMLRSLCRISFTLRTDPARMRPVDVPFQQADIRRLMEDTGWSPKIPLRRSLKELLQAQRQALGCG